MANVLVTGGTGDLGHHLVPLLAGLGHDVTIGSRRPAPREDGVSVVRLDLLNGDGIEEAVKSSEVIIHAASDATKPQKVDVEGSARLLAAAERLRVEHLIYASIVGVDQHPLKYYRAKLAVEHEIEASSVPFSILRATQFHQLVKRFADAQRMLPVMFGPRGVRFQVIDAAAVAAGIVDLVESGPRGRVQDLGGPEALPLKGLMRDYLRATGRRRPVIGFRMPGASGKAFRKGLNLSPHRNVGSMTWREYVDSVGSARPEEGVA